LGQLRNRRAPNFFVGRHCEKPEERADAPYSCKAHLERAAFASVTLVEATREGTARARAVGVDCACAAVTQRPECRTGLLEGFSSLEHVEMVLAGATKLLGLEGDAPEQGSIATESTRAT
jgi:hypothetical protein